MGQYFDCWYVIRSSKYMFILNIVLVSPCVSIHVFTSDASLFQSLIGIICSHWFIHFEISVWRSIQNLVIGSFLIFMIDKACNFCLYAPHALTLTVDQYAVGILVLSLLFLCSSIHGQQPRFMNSWPVAITLHYISSMAMISVSPILNVPLYMVTWLYLVLTLLF